MKRRGILLAGVGALLVVAVILVCMGYQQSKREIPPKPVIAKAKEEAVNQESQKPIPQETLDGILEHFKRRDVALDLEQAHGALYAPMKDKARRTKGDELDTVLYGMALEYLENLSVENAKEVLSEADQPGSDKNIRELLAYADNGEKARMIVLFEMEYLKADGLIVKND